jgi:hypothetical protein
VRPNQTILSAAKLNNSPTICDEPRCPVPKRSAGAFSCARQVTTRRSILSWRIGSSAVGVQ